jgi:hypothetical protein
MSLVAPRGTERIARQVADLLADTGAELPRLHALGRADAPARVVAVDGSSVSLAESGDLLLAAFRAGSVGIEKGAAMPPRVPAPEVVLLTRADARAIVAERLEALGLPAHGVPRLDAGSALDALRTLDEMQAALEALEGLDEGDLLLIDGALQARGHVPLVDCVLARAAERGVDVVGVCKSTSITLGRAPALVVCQLAGRSVAARTWLAALPAPPSVRAEVWAARLSPAEERVFRFDVAAASRASADRDAPPGASTASARPAADVLAGVAALCGHPAYPGYPSPLAMAHNAVLLNEDARGRIRAAVQEAALQAGVEPRAWEMAFVDYHDVLELGA